jgi:hypothetical protein
MAQPWPPGDEPEIPDADLGTVKPTGQECAREWPAGPPGADYYAPPGPDPNPPAALAAGAGLAAGTAAGQDPSAGSGAGAGLAAGTGTGQDPVAEQT